MQDSTPSQDSNEPITFPARRTPKIANLPLGLALATGFALLLTVTSVWLYSSTGANRLDLSRPGFERERAEVTDSEPRRAYDTTSPVTSQSIDDFLTEYDQRITKLDGFSGFSNQSALNDSNLKLSDPQKIDDTPAAPAAQ